MVYSDKNYWLYIAPYVYWNIIKTKALLYNTVNGSSMEVTDSKNVELLVQMHKKENLGAILLKGKKYSNQVSQEFIKEFCNNRMGELLDSSMVIEKPIQLMPILNLQRDVEKNYSGEDILQYLHEINIFLNNSCSLGCKACDKTYQQTLCCTKYRFGGGEIPISMLKNVFSQLQYGVVGKVNLLGGNIFKYSYFEELINLLADYKEQVHLWTHYANVDQKMNKTSLICNDIIVNFPILEKRFEQTYLCLQGLHTKYHFYITNEKEYIKTEELINKLKLQTYEIHPVYTYTNIDFFEEYIYTAKSDILKSTIPFQNIFANQKINRNFFGSLTIIPNGNTHASLNSIALGNIKEMTLLELIHKEMLNNTSWRTVRNSEPCSNCLYQYLCPSPSNYEKVMGKSNLCHIN